MKRVPRLDPALVPWAWSRAAIWIVAALAAALLAPDHPRAHGPTPGGPGYWYRVWANWDGAWFVRIAEHGYASHAGTAAFYPLYPGIVAVIRPIVGGNTIAAGIVVSLAAGAVAFVLLGRLTALELGEPSARRAVIALAIFPLSFFLQAVYSEALFLMLAVAAFFFARRERWTVAAAALALAFLTRPAAVAVWAGVLVLAWRAPLRRRALAWVAPAPLAFALFPLHLHMRVHDAFAFLHDETYWHRHLSRFGPFGGIYDGALAAVHGVNAVARTPTPADWTYPANLSLKQVAAVNVEAFAWLLVFAALTVAVWRLLGAAYGVMCVLSLALPLAEPWDVFPLFSLPRFGLVVFPFFMALAALASTRARATALTAFAVVYLGFDVVRWALWYWVA